MSYSDDNTFEKILNRCLANDRLVDVDKRVGSIIYDALAPVCLELADAYVKMDILEEQTYLMTATGNNLNRRVYDYGISRRKATRALRIAEFKQYKVDSQGNYVLDENNQRILIDMEIETGIRFAIPENAEITYEYIGKTDGYKILECEQTGTQGNEHLGTILPLTPILNLAQANIISTYKPAEDDETDTELRARAVASLNYGAFGGNIQDYIERVNAIDGVGQTKVFPAWQYNGSVLLSVVDPLYNPITTEFARNLKEQIDPEDSTGQGIGIAPIGHYVTITTPTRQDVDVALTIEFLKTETIETIQEEVERKIEEYFLSIRQSYKQDVNLTIYRARIIEKVLELEFVLNVTDVKLNGEMNDIVYVDEGLLGKQYLPYLRSVTIE
jgi:uncharacterized phage protein gp47/JayE